MEYILSQIFVCISYLFLGLSYFTKKRNIILCLSLVAIIANGISYFLLGAWAGVGVICVALIRNVLFLLQSKIKALDKYKIDDWIILILLLIIFGIVAVLTFDTIFSLFTIASSVLYTISVWQKNIMTYKILGIISSLCSLLYFIFIKSIFGFVLEFVMFIVAFSSIILYVKQKNIDKISTDKSVSKLEKETVQL